MFRKIKNRIVRGRKLQAFPTAKVLQEHEDRLIALEQGTPLVRNIEFTVTDGEDPIEGATVSIGSVDKTTDSDGECTFQDIEEGTVSVTVTKEGYTTKTESITVDSDHTSFTISLTATESTRNISFTINDGNNGVEGAVVTIGESTGTTGSQGGCTLQNVTDGEHTVTVTADGYNDYTGTITVSEDNTSFTISLTAT